MRPDTLRKIEREIKEDTYLSCGAKVKRSEEADREKKKSISGFFLSFFLTLTLFRSKNIYLETSALEKKLANSTFKEVAPLEVSGVTFSHDKSNF
jgi:hypothetical protein